MGAGAEVVDGDVMSGGAEEEGEGGMKGVTGNGWQRTRGVDNESLPNDSPR